MSNNAVNVGDSIPALEIPPIKRGTLALYASDFEFDPVFDIPLRTPRRRCVEIRR